MNEEEWKSYGIIPEIAVSWFHLGFEDPEQAIPWMNAGIDANDAFLWRSYGFQVLEALNWRGIGLDPIMSYNWKNAGFVPEEVSILSYHGKDYMDIIEALEKGENKEDIMEIIYNIGI